MWPLILKDLRRRLRRPASTLVMVAFPLLMSLALGSVFGGGGANDRFPPIHILVENQDPDGFLANALVNALGSPRSGDFIQAEAVGDEGRSMMEKGKASALVVIPEGFSQALLDSRPTVIHIVRNPSEGIKPEIVVLGSELVATYLDQGSRLLGGELGQIKELVDARQIPPAAKVGAVAARITERLSGARDYLFPPLVGIASAKEAEPEGANSSTGGGVFGYVLMMTTVMALLFVAVRSVGDLFEEQNSGMLRRQLATPMPVARIIAAKFLFSVVLGLLVMAILATTGLALGWLDVPAAPGAAILLGLVFNLAACGVVAVIMGLSGNEKQAGIMSWLIVMGMSALGGSMVPLQQLPAAMRGLADYTLNYWAIDGFSQVMFEGAGMGDVAGNLAVLAGTGLLLSVLANALLVRRFRKVAP